MGLAEKTPPAQSNGYPIKIVGTEKLMPSHFRKHEHQVRACLIEQLRKAVGSVVHRATTWKGIRDMVNELFEEMCKKEFVLPEKAIDIKVISLEKYNQDDAKKKTAAMLGFSSFEMMMKCIELGKKFEEGKDLAL